MGYKLICFDMDGVIFPEFNFWMKVHEIFGTLEEGKVLTKQYLDNDYDSLVEHVVNGLWKGKDTKEYFKLVNSYEYLPGVSDVFDFVKKKDWVTAIISGSSLDVARKVQKDFGIDHLYANEMIIKDGKVSGEFIWPVGAGKGKKAKIIRDLCSDLGIDTSEVIYIGDSYLDIEAFKEVGLSIAFNSSCDELKEIASFVVEGTDLSKVIGILPNS